MGEVDYESRDCNDESDVYTSMKRRLRLRGLHTVSVLSVASPILHFRPIRDASSLAHRFSPPQKLTSGKGDLYHIEYLYIFLHGLQPCHWRAQDASGCLETCATFAARTGEWLQDALTDSQTQAQVRRLEFGSLGLADVGARSEEQYNITAQAC